MKEVYPNLPRPSSVAALRKALARDPGMIVEAVTRLETGEWAEDEEIYGAARLLDVCIAVWSNAVEQWIYHFHNGLGDDNQLEDCKAILYMINSGGENVEQQDKDALGLHFDLLIPNVPQDDLFQNIDQDAPKDTNASENYDDSNDDFNEESDSEEDDKSPSTEEDDADAVFIDLDIDYDEDDEEESEPINAEEYAALNLDDRYDRVRKLLISYEETDDMETRYRAQSQLMRLREDVVRDRVKEHPHYGFTLEDAPIGNPGFELTDNQRFLKKLLSPDTDNRGVLLFHGVGVGKTCSAVQIATNFVHFYSNRTLVILPSNLENNFRKELFNIDRVNFASRTYDNCHGNRYLDRIPDWHLLGPTVLSREVQKMINTEFEFMGFLRVVNLLNRMASIAKRHHVRKEDAANDIRAQIRARFSDRVVVIDEVHNIRTMDDSNEESHAAKLFPKALRMIMRDAIGIRLVMLTATPMFNNANEITWLMDVMYSCDKTGTHYDTNVEFTRDDKLTAASKANLGYFARHYVSYLRGQDPEHFPARLENVDDDTRFAHPTVAFNGVDELRPVDTLVLTASRMGKVQRAAYVETVRTTKGTNAMSRLDQISNLMYPGTDSYGAEGFRMMFQGESVPLRYRDTVEERLTEKSLETHGCKLASILRHVRTAEGIVLVYSSYIYSGLLPLAIALEHAGYTKYGVPLLQQQGEGAGKKKGGYIMITAKQWLSANNDDELRVLNDPSNSNGERIKVVLISQAGSEGLDLKCVREIHVMEPWHNLNKLEQVIGRGVRFRSHDALPKEKRNVTVFRHVALLSKKVESINYQRYRRAAGKQRRIEAVEAVLSRNALDCPLNIKRNRRNIAARSVTDSKGTARELPASTDASSRCSGSREVEVLRDFEKESALTMVDVVAIAKRIAAYAENESIVYARMDSILKLPQFKDRPNVVRAALAWLGRVRHRVRIGEQDGVVVPLKDAFLFQPDAIHDTKITTRDRLTSPPTRVARVGLATFDPREQEDMAATLEESDTQTARDVLKSMEESVSNLRERIGNIVEDALDSNVLTDMVIDRMNRPELRRLIRAKEDRPESVTRSLREGLIVPFENKEVFYDPFERIFYNFDGTKATVVRNDKFVRALRKRRTEASDWLGFVEPGGAFKMLNPDKIGKVNQVGTSCVSTSSIKVSDVQRFAKSLIGTQVAAKEKIMKNTWCEVYEYALRRTNRVQRPITKIIATEKN